MGVGAAVAEAHQVPRRSGGPGRGGEAVQAPARVEAAAGRPEQVADGVQHGVGVVRAHLDEQVAVTPRRVERVAGEGVHPAQPAGSLPAQPEPVVEQRRPHAHRDGQSVGRHDRARTPESAGGVVMPTSRGRPPVVRKRARPVSVRRTSVSPDLSSAVTCRAMNAAAGRGSGRMPAWCTPWNADVWRCWRPWACPARRPPADVPPLPRPRRPAPRGTRAPGHRPRAGTLCAVRPRATAFPVDRVAVVAGRVMTSSSSVTTRPVPAVERAAQVGGELLALPGGESRRRRPPAGRLGAPCRPVPPRGSPTPPSAEAGIAGPTTGRSRSSSRNLPARLADSVASSLAALVAARSARRVRCPRGSRARAARGTADRSARCGTPSATGARRRPAGRPTAAPRVVGPLPQHPLHPVEAAEPRLVRATGDSEAVDALAQVAEGVVRRPQPLVEGVRAQPVAPRRRPVAGRHRGPQCGGQRDQRGSPGDPVLVALAVAPVLLVIGRGARLLRPVAPVTAVAAPVMMSVSSKAHWNA